MPKILVIRFSSIGDIVLTTPVFRCIKKQIPDAELHFVTKLNYKIVTATNPYIDKFFYVDNDLPGIIEKLKQLYPVSEDGTIGSMEQGTTSWSSKCGSELMKRILAAAASEGSDKQR